MPLMTSRGSLCIAQPLAILQSWTLVIGMVIEEPSWKIRVLQQGMEATEWAEILRSTFGHIPSGGCKCGQAIFHAWIYFLLSKTKDFRLTVQDSFKFCFRKSFLPLLLESTSLGGSRVTIQAQYKTFSLLQKTWSPRTLSKIPHCFSNIVCLHEHCKRKRVAPPPLRDCHVILVP